MGSERVASAEARWWWMGMWEGVCLGDGGQEGVVVGRLMTCKLREFVQVRDLECERFVLLLLLLLSLLVVKNEESEEGIIKC